MTAAKNIAFKDRWRGENYLFSPAVDFLMTGGGSIVAMIFILLFVPTTYAQETFEVEFIALLLFFSIAAETHIFYSLQLLYSSLADKLRNYEDNKTGVIPYLVIGVILPIVLIIVISIMAFANPTKLFFIGTGLVIFLAGWHFTKQCYGVWIYLSVIKKIFYNNLEKRIMKCNIYFIWIASWLAWSDGYETQAQYLGIGKGLPIYEALAAVKDFVLYRDVLLISFTLALVIIARKHIKNKTFLSITASCAYFSVYPIYALTMLSSPLWIILAPGFHALQYIHFVWAYKINESKYKIDIEKSEKKSARNKAYVFLAIGILLGWPLFNSFPRFIDFGFDSNFLSPDHPSIAGVAALFSTCAVIFFNLMHYFTDALIWRRSNADAGKYLFYKK